MWEPLRRWLDVLLPPVCAGCGRAATDALCARCRGEIGSFAPDACTRCQLRSTAPGQSACAACALAPGPLAACIAAAPLDAPLQRYVHRFKYPGPGLVELDPAPGAVLRQLMREAVVRAPGPGPDQVVPVPLHRARLHRRGFNPAERLARVVARRTGAPCAATALLRTRDTPSQTERGRTERARNVAGAFAVRPGARIGRCVWLVDDVVTTGATLDAAAKPLHAAGAERIVALCVARTPG